jgi:excisionase family DNA binding protein
MNTEKIILTVIEMAEYLRIGRSKAYKLISDNEIKHIKVGKQIRIPKFAIDEWMISECNKAS